MLQRPLLLDMFSQCHQMITQQQPKGPQWLSEVAAKSRFFGQILTCGVTQGIGSEIAPGAPVIG